MIFNGQYSFDEDDSDEGPGGNESDESSPPTSQEECEKSPDFIPPSHNSKLPAKKRRKISKSVPEPRKQPIQRKQQSIMRKQQPVMKKQPAWTIQGKHVHHDQQKGQLQSIKSSAPLRLRPKYSSSTLAHKTGSVSVRDMHLC